MAAAIWFLMLVPLFSVVAGSESTSQFNRTDFEAAMADMRAKSYHGFVILLKILEGSPNFVQSSDVTFLMPNDEELSAPELSLEHMKNFVLSHTIPSALLFNNMLHFPDGTSVPTSLPGKRLAITNNHGLFLNNARIVNANVCGKSLIKCHGISSAISFNNRDGDGDADADAPPPPTSIPDDGQAPPPLLTSSADDLRALDSMDYQKTRTRAKPSPSIHMKRNSPLS